MLFNQCPNNTCYTRNVINSIEMKQEGRSPTPATILVGMLHPHIRINSIGMTEVSILV